MSSISLISSSRRINCLALIGRCLVIISLGIVGGCSGKFSSKLEATKVILPPDSASKLERGNLSVTVEAGTFSEPVELDAQVDNGRVVSTALYKGGAKVLNGDLAKSVHFCVRVDSSNNKDQVYISVEIEEDSSPRRDTIPNKSIAFSEVNDELQVCWFSKYVNATFQVELDGAQAVQAKLTLDNCVDPDLLRVPTDQTLTLCDGTFAKGMLDLNFDARDIKAGRTIAGIVGSYAPDFPDPANVYNDTVNGIKGRLTLPAPGNVYTGLVYGVAGSGSTGTLTVAALVPPKAWDIRAGTTVNGVTGQLKVSCRNSANPTRFDAEEFKAATADDVTDVFTVAAHGYADNDTIRFTAQSSPGGLSANNTYYVRNSSPNTFQLATSSDGLPIDFTTVGNQIVVYREDGGYKDIWDTIDDYNNNGDLFTVDSTPTNWNSSQFCGGVGPEDSNAVWIDTTADGNCDNFNDECRFTDKISGLEWSEVQSSNASWGSAITICGNLDFGGAGAWRLPTQKELMAAYVNGIYSAATEYWASKGKFGENYTWSSTTVSTTATSAWVVFLNYGTTTYFDKSNMLQVMCVR